MHANLFNILFPAWGQNLSGKFLQIIMPVQNILFIVFYIRYTNPFAYFHLSPVLFCTFMNLEKILKRMIFIKTSERKEAADSRTVAVNTAPPLIIQKNTGIILVCHLKVWENHSVNYIKLNGIFH